MIRDRRPEDLDRLCAVLRSLDHPPGSATDGLREWLENLDAEQSWVFDKAPVTVAPTKNVVGHLQIYSPTDDESTARLVERAGKPATCLLALGRLFVAPDPHAYGIGRFLLTESVRYIRERGKIPVLVLSENGPVPQGLCQRIGFEEVPSTHLGAALIHTGADRR